MVLVNDNLCNANNVDKFCCREKVTIPEKKPFIFLRGNGKGKTAISWSQSSADNTESATLKIQAPHVVVFGLSIKVYFRSFN